MPAFIHQHRTPIAVALCVITIVYAALVAWTPETASALGIGYICLVVTVVVLLRSYGHRHDR